jgi:succinate dehydrogenase / fumarate reductase membrane anchor subunit
MSGYRTPLGRARGLGAAKTGVGHFIGQRVSAVALIALALWLVSAATTIARGDFDSAILWLRNPVNATLACLTTLAAFYHMQLGMRVIIEDYIERPVSRMALLIANLLVCLAAAALTIICLLKVAFAAGVS